MGTLTYFAFRALLMIMDLQRNTLKIKLELSKLQSVTYSKRQSQIQKNFIVLGKRLHLNLIPLLQHQLGAMFGVEVHHFVSGVTYPILMDTTPVKNGLLVQDKVHLLNNGIIGNGKSCLKIIIFKIHQRFNTMKEGLQFK